MTERSCDEAIFDTGVEADRLSTGKFGTGGHGVGSGIGTGRNRIGRNVDLRLGHPQPPRSGPQHRTTLGADGGLDQFDAATGTNHPRVGPQRRDGHRAQDLHRHPAHPEAGTRLAPFDHVTQQCRGRPGVLGVGRPRTASQLGRVKQRRISGVGMVEGLHKSLLPHRCPPSGALGPRAGPVFFRRGHSLQRASALAAHHNTGPANRGAIPAGCGSVGRGPQWCCRNRLHHIHGDYHTTFHRDRSRIG